MPHSATAAAAQSQTPVRSRSHRHALQQACRIATMSHDATTSVRSRTHRSSIALPRCSRATPVPELSGRSRTFRYKVTTPDAHRAKTAPQSPANAARHDEVSSCPLSDVTTRDTGQKRTHQSHPCSRLSTDCRSPCRRSCNAAATTPRIVRKSRRYCNACWASC